MELEKVLRRAIAGACCEDCMAFVRAAGTEPGECGSCDEECEACAGRAARALAARMMPQGVEWPRFEDGGPVRFGDLFDACGEAGMVERIELMSNGWAAVAEDCGPRDLREPGFRFVRPEPEDTQERVTRCADCRHARATPLGLVCALHVSAGWFATEADGFCHRGEAR